MTATAAISSDIDLFSDSALQDPYPLYKGLRDLGPAAYLVRHGVYFLGRYDQVRAALGNWEAFSSARGVGLTGPAQRELTNITRGFAHLPMQIV